MGKPYSVDLRERVVAAVESGGLSCHRAAEQFGVGVSTAINWVKRWRQTGSVAQSRSCTSLSALVPVVRKRIATDRLRGLPLPLAAGGHPL